MTPLWAGLAESFETSMEPAFVKSVAAVPAARSVTPTTVSAEKDEPEARATGASDAITSEGPANSIAYAGAVVGSVTVPSPVRRTVAVVVVIAGTGCAVAWLASAVALSETSSSSVPDVVTV